MEIGWIDKLNQRFSSKLYLREAIKKKKFIFSEKGREGVGPNPHFYIRIIWDPTLREGGAKLLFPKSKFHLVWFLGLYPNFILSQSHMFCSGTGD